MSEQQEVKNTEEEKEAIAERIDDFKEMIGTVVFVIIIIYFTMIRTGWLSDTVTGLKYDNPSDYFKDGKSVVLTFEYPKGFLINGATAELTLNGITIGTLSAGDEKIITLNLQPGKVYRLRAKNGSSTKKIKFIPNDNTDMYNFTYDGSELRDSSVLTEY